MTRKERILRFISKLDDDVSYDKVMYHLDVMKSVEIGIEQADRGELIDHDELFDSLLKKYEKRPPGLDAKSNTGPSGDSGVHRKGRSPESGSIHRASQTRGRKPKKAS